MQNWVFQYDENKNSAGRLSESLCELSPFNGNGINSYELSSINLFYIISP